LRMRAMFVIYLTVIAIGIALALISGLLHL
jgi:hypothetical protein